MCLQAGRGAHMQGTPLRDPLRDPSCPRDRRPSFEGAVRLWPWGAA